jgi:ribulose-5-phosphate 4-epimerase/fuculose-1-phosphate aldolase
VGDTLFQAFDRMEVLEAAARMTWIAATMGCKKPLLETRLSEIERVYGK